MYEHLALLALFIFLYSLVARRLEKTPVSGPMLFVVFGLILSIPELGLPPREVSPEYLRFIAELTLSLVLFSDAANANLGLLRHNSQLPGRLLLVGLPLTILAGICGAVGFFPQLGLFEAAILATVLAPTDAALGQAVVTNRNVPPVIRDGLNVESGLNDGICVPILFVFLAMAADAAGNQEPLSLAVKLVAEEIGIGLVSGLGVTFLGVSVVKFARKKGWVAREWYKISGMALALSCFATAQWFGGSGFIASFTGGLLAGGMIKKDKEDYLTVTETIGDIFGLVTWVSFGYAVLSQALQGFDWTVFLYALLSLTLFRMVPVWLSLAGTRMDLASKLFTGWFGPRGLASIVFVIIVSEQNLPGGKLVMQAVVWTIILSVFAHGLSAAPLSNSFSRHEKNFGGINRRLD